MIQQSINQTLSLAGFLYSQTEDAKTQQATRKLEKEYGQQEKLIKAQTELKIPSKNRDLRRDGYAPNYEKADDKDLNAIMALKKRKEELAEELYKISPTEHYQKLEDSGGEVEEVSMAMNKKAEAQAKKEAQAQAEAQAKADEDAYYQQQADEDEAELARRKQEDQQLAEASQTIQARIKDPFAIADEELQRAVQRKNEIERRKKGGMML